MHLLMCILLSGGEKSQNITDAIAKDNMPLSSVERKGFKNLMKVSVPLYKCPGRMAITRLLEGKYEVISSS